MRATFYARCSTDTDEQKNSIDNQVSFFEEYIVKKEYQFADCGVFCKRDGSIRPRKGYIDEGFSGAKSARYRKAFQQMIRDAKAKKFDIIFTKNISRFGRNVQEILRYIADLRELGIGVYFEDVNINTLDRTDDIKITIFAALAEEESRAKSDSVQFGKKQGYEKGIWGGREPYGYNINNGKLMVNEEEAEIVKEIFRLYLHEGKGLGQIAKVLTEKRVPTKLRIKAWDKSLISKVLKNGIYTGEIRLHRTQKTDINRGTIKKIPLEDQIVKQDETLRLIDDETFRLVQIEKEKRLVQFGQFSYTENQFEDVEGNIVEKKVRKINRANGRYSSVHIFSNILKCGNCGGSLRRKVQKTNKQSHIYWVCRNNDSMGKLVCSYRNRQTEGELIAWVKAEVEKYKKNNRGHKNNLNNIIKTKYDMNNLDQKIDIFKKKLNDLGIERDANFKFYTRNIFSEKEFESRHKRINDDYRDTESKLDQLVNIERELKNLRDKYEEFLKFLNDIDTDNLSNVVLRRIIDKIECTTYEEEDHISFIHGNYFEPYKKEIYWNFMGVSEGDISRDLFFKVMNDYPEEMAIEDYLKDREIEKGIGLPLL
ncbi:recombinase family protein [Paenibacillus sp. FSL K6-2524]|uniref:recombinase family protein n=1 Tax=Paenibacillus sp. FSL K6-2524 TaxID=2954516 RepID=UPI0030FCDBE2